MIIGAIITLSVSVTKTADGLILNVGGVSCEAD